MAFAIMTGKSEVKTMKMLYLDVQNNEVKVVEANGLDDYYRYIGCNTVDIVHRVIGELDVEIVCDDEAMFADYPKVSAIDKSGYPCLYGNLLIAGGFVTDGELTPLTDREIAYLKQHLVLVTTKQYPEPYQVFYKINY